MDNDHPSKAIRLDGILSNTERNIALLAHELRTPLAGISGLVTLLHEGAVGELTARQRSVMDLVRRNVSHLECLVTEFLDFAAIETGTLRLQPKKIRVQEAVGEVVALLQPDGAARGVTIASRVRPSDAMVVLDPTRFREVLFNLLSNAVRHSPDGGRVDVVVTVDGSGLALVVGDEGDGIHEAVREHLFDSFEGHDPGGHGLGLSVVQGIVHAQGGHVSVHEGSPGTVFRIHLPEAGLKAAAPA